jgi:Ca2+-dependent lipid-binding protein, contains C2 domain
MDNAQNKQTLKLSETTTTCCEIPVTQRLCSRQQQVEVSSHNLREVRTADNWQSVKLIIITAVLTHPCFSFFLLPPILLVTLFLHLPCIFFCPPWHSSP